MLVVKESRPLLVYQHTVCLNAEIYAAAAQVIFFDSLGEVLEIVESGKQRLTALERECHAVPSCKVERAFYEPVRGLCGHNAEVVFLSYLRDIVIESVFAAQVAETRCGLYHYRKFGQNNTSGYCCRRADCSPFGGNLSVIFSL